MIIGAMLWIISLSNLVAQESPATNVATLKSFERAFAGATNVKWTSVGKGISLAAFNHKGDYRLAYYTREGKIISSGKKIRNTHDLPVLVSESLYRVKNFQENKVGALALGSVYEMVEGDITKYFVSMQNHKVSFMYEINTSGHAQLWKRQKLELKSYPPKNVIARRDRRD